MRNTLGPAVLLVAAATLAVAVAGDPATTRPTMADGSKIDQLIADLGSDSYAVRESAQKRIIEIGVPARKALHAVTRSDDPEVRLRTWVVLKAIHSNQEILVKDLGKVPGPSQHLWLSPNGKRLAYILKLDGRESLVCDGRKGPVWDGTAYVGPFSRDSTRFGYQAVKDGRAFIVFVGEEDKPLTTPEALRAVYSPDGKRVAFTVRKGGEQWVVRDGKEGPHYRRVSLGRFSPDGKRFAYTAMDDKGNRFVVLDGESLGRYKGVGSLAFSPDSKRFAYTARREGKMMVVCDGKEGKAYDEVLYPLFSPNAKGLAYWTRTANRKMISVVWNERVVGRMTAEAHLAFSPDGRQLAWGTQDGEVYRCGKIATRIASGRGRATRPVFSPDGKHVAYAAGKDKDLKWGVRVDDQALRGRYDPASVLAWSGPQGGGTTMSLRDLPGFSADGRHVFFKGTRGSRRRNRRQFIVIDGIEGPAHDAVWIPEDFKSYPKRLRYVVRDGTRVRLVEMAWPEPLTWQDAIEPAKQ